MPDVITPSTPAGDVTSLVYEITADSSGNATGQTSVVVPGVLFACGVVPGTGGDLPSDNFDLVVNQGFAAVGGGSVSWLGTDLAGGALANLDNASTSLVTFWPDEVVPVAGRIQIVASGLGNGKKVRVELQIARGLRLQRSEAAVPLTGGAAAQVLQYLGPGAAKFVTLSGQAAVADGGAVTLQGSPTFTSVSAGTGTFSSALAALSLAVTNAIAAATLTLSGLLTGAAATFSGLLTANGGASLRGSTVERVREGAAAILNVKGYRDTGYTTELAAYGARGTELVPTLVDAGKEILLLDAFAHNGSSFVNVARISMQMGVTPASGDMPGEIEFFTVPEGSESLVSRAVIESNGRWRVKSGKVQLDSLPTSSAGLGAGEVWNDGGTLKIVT